MPINLKTERELSTKLRKRQRRAQQLYTQMIYRYEGIPINRRIQHLAKKGVARGVWSSSGPKPEKTAAEFISLELRRKFEREERDRRGFNVIIIQSIQGGQ